MGWTRWTQRLLIVLTFTGLGCAPAETGPSYADLVVIYNAEVEALDRLEAKREKLILARAAAVRESKGALPNLQGLLDEVTQLKEQTLDADPNAVIDDLANRSGRAEELAGQLLEGLLQGTRTEAEEDDPADAEPSSDDQAEVFARELDTLNNEIEEQRARVERARKARDAAESSQTQ